MRLPVELRPTPVAAAADRSIPVNLRPTPAVVAADPWRIYHLHRATATVRKQIHKSHRFGDGL
ncbi:hypothetical protein ACP4OV_009765 [Aristida adscensionis]